MKCLCQAMPLQPSCAHSQTECNADTNWGVSLTHLGATSGAGLQIAGQRKGNRMAAAMASLPLDCS